MNAARFGLLVMVCISVFVSASMVAQQGSAPEPIVPVMSQDDAEAFAARFESIFDGPDLDIADELFSPDFVGHLPLAPELTRDGWKDYVASFYLGFSDMRQQTHEVIVSADRVVLRVSYAGTHDGPIFGIPATGNPVVMTATGIFSFDEDGLVTENWADLDVVGVLAQIGAFPPAS